LEELTMDTETLHTHCPAGLYRAEFVRADIEAVTSRKTGREYVRLTVRFRLGEGPFVHPDEKGWQSHGHRHAGRVVPLWHELDVDASGHPSLSPNAWFAPGVLQRKGRTLAEKLNAEFGAVRWVAVRRSPGRPASIHGLSYGDKHPSPDWVAQCCGC
jgi:hypothetical protein